MAVRVSKKFKAVIRQQLIAPIPHAPLARRLQRPECDRCKQAIALNETYQHPPGEFTVWAHVECLRPELEAVGRVLPKVARA